MPWIVVSVAAKDVMHLVNEFPGGPQKTVIGSLPKEAEAITDRERVGPQIATRFRLSRDAGGIRKFLHQVQGKAISHTLPMPCSSLS
jgi:hypothetical protein